MESPFSSLAANSESAGLGGFNPKQHAGFITGGAASIGALGYGFSDCAFDIDTVDACVEHASGLIDTFYGVGMHIIQWAIAIFQAAFSIQ